VKALLFALMVTLELLVAALFSLKYLMLEDKHPLDWPWPWPLPWALEVFRHRSCEEAFDLVSLSFVSYAVVTVFAAGLVGFRWRMAQLRRRYKSRTRLPTEPTLP